MGGTASKSLFVSAALGLGLVATLSCSRGRETPLPVRLVDHFSAARVVGSPPLPEAAPPTEMRFTGGEAIGARWAAGPRVADLHLTEEGLTGRAAGPQPALYLELPEAAGEGDVLHEIAVRLRASAGQSLSLTALGEGGPPSEALAGPPNRLTLETPLLPGPEPQTYTLNLARVFAMGPLARSAITRLILRPTNAAGAEFTLESVKLTFRNQRLAAISTGIGWHGLQQVWRDTVVARAPERITWTLTLPPDPWLDVALGTVSLGAVGFDVALAEPGGEPRVVFQETLTTAERWRERRIDLDDWAGREVELSFAARGEEGALAFWGSPVVRSGAAAPSGGDRPTGVIVLLADTLRRDHLAAYGHHRQNSPHLSRLAEEGVLFKDAISQGTWTKVSVPSILASLYPSTHGIVTFNDRLSPVAVTLAEALQGAGYATWASSSVAFSGQLTNLHQGVEVLHEAASISDDEFDAKTGRTFIGRLLPWLERHRDVPFFAFVHAMDPHSPYQPYPPYDTVYTDPEAGPRHLEQIDQIRPHIESPMMRVFGMPNREEMEAAGVEIEPYVEHERAWYDASILALDAELGRLLDALRTLGREQDTVIALVSDHGEEFLEHGNHWHGLNVYAEMIEVPMILSWPAGLSGGKVVDATVQTIDLMPTLLDLVGLPIPETAQGRSLRSLWADGASSVREVPAVAERRTLLREGEDPTMVSSDSIAILHSEWKLIWNTRRAEGVPEHELYHRPSDPLDQTDLAADQPEIVAELKSLLDRWQSAALAAALPSDADAAGELSAEELERLRSLGYI